MGAGERLEVAGLEDYAVESVLGPDWSCKSSDKREVRSSIKQDGGELEVKDEGREVTLPSAPVQV